MSQIITSDESTKIEIRNLNFFYGKFHALRNVNMSIKEKKVTAFIGPSGCGKSTLLRTLNRMYELYPGQRAEGEILLDNEKPADVQAGHFPDPRQSGHGVPETDTVPHEHL